jgi:plastocyanin
VRRSALQRSDFARGLKVNSSVIQVAGTTVPTATGLIARQTGVDMKTLLAVPLFALAAIGPAAAQTLRPAVVSVTMENFKFEPNAIQLRAGVPTVLHLVNNSGGGHSFAAPEFFAAASVAPASRPLVHEGKVDLAKHSAVDVELTPAAGQYPLKCSHTLHAAFGMTGTIVVR